MKKLLKTILTLCLTAIIGLTCLSGCADKTAVKIGIPNDGTNLSRALKVLESAGIIELDAEAGYSPEVKDITKYVYNVEIIPTSANTLTQLLDDYGACIINGTFAQPYGLIPSRDALAIEDQGSGEGNPYVNIIVAKSNEKNKTEYTKIVEAFQTDLVAKYTLIKYSEMFIPAFTYNNYDTSSYGTDQDFVNYIDNYTSTKNGKTVVNIGVVGGSTDYWKAVQKVLDDEQANIYIERTIFSAYNIPNEAVNSGDVDLNSFQHKAFLANDIEANGYQIESIGDTIMSPLSLYSKKYSNLDALKNAAGLKG